MAFTPPLKVGTLAFSPSIYHLSYWSLVDNMMCLSNETWSLTRLSLHIQNTENTTNTIKTSFQIVAVAPSDCMVRWNSNNHGCHILNVDGSCIGTPTQAGFGGVIQNSACFYLSGFSGFIPTSTNIFL